SDDLALVLEVVHDVFLALWLVVSMLHTVVSVVKRASRGLEPRCLPAWLLVLCGEVLVSVLLVLAHGFLVGVKVLVRDQPDGRVIPGHAILPVGVAVGVRLM